MTMEITFDKVNEVREKYKVRNLFSLKEELLKESKTFQKEIVFKLWKSYVKHNLDPYITLYIHTPFCLNKRCNYCMYKSQILADFSELNVYLDEMEMQAKEFNEIFKDIEFKALYLGGGTASIYTYNQLKRLYSIIFNNFRFSNKATLNQEFSFRTTDEEKLKLSFKYGFNRFSFGVQSFDPHVLKLANREYPDIEKIKRLVDSINKTPERTVTCDLMMGLPGDSLEKFHDSLKKAIDLGTLQITIYDFLNQEFFKKRNKNNPLYYKYIKPYHYHEIKKIFQKLINEFPDYNFNFSGSEAIVISKKRINLPKLILTSYYSNPIITKKNSNLGLGKYSQSFIENQVNYYCEDFNEYRLLFYKKKYYYKISFILELLMYYSKIDTEEYKKVFNSNLEDDFKEQIEFLIKNNKLRKEGKYYLPIDSALEDLINLGLAFLPKEELVKLLNNESFKKC